MTNRVKYEVDEHEYVTCTHCPLCRRKYEKARYASIAAERKASAQDYRDRNRNKVRASQKTRRDSVRAEAIEVYGGHCVCCGETYAPGLELDHPNNDGNHWRKLRGGATGELSYLQSAGWPEDALQVLCGFCHRVKTYGAMCPDDGRHFIYSSVEDVCQF